jgi:hypothetical protein
MKRIATISILSSLIGISEAALPPEYQNQNDLDFMVEYVRNHPVVAAKLKAICLKNYTIYFGDYCKVVFGRQEIDHPEDWMGPANPLEFKSATCPVD